MNLQLQKKVCSSCKNELTYDSFYKNKRSKDGLTCYCKKCSKVRVEKYVAENKQNLIESRKKYYKKNKNKLLKKAKKWRKENKEKIKDFKKTCYENNKHIFKARRDSLQDWYVADLLGKNILYKTGIHISVKEVPAELIEQKRCQLKKYRELKQSINEPMNRFAEKLKGESINERK